jgi:hypothetical protein
MERPKKTAPTEAVGCTIDAGQNGKTEILGILAGGREGKMEILVKVVVPILTAILGAVSAVFREDIRNLFHFSASKDNEYLLGAWECTWDTLAPAPREPIQDRAEITRVRGNLVKGGGVTPRYGPWDMDGRAADLAGLYKLSAPDRAAAEVSIPVHPAID